MGRVVAEDIPLEGLAEQGDVDARPAEVHHRQACKCLGQELQKQVFEQGDEVGHDDEQSALPHPFGRGRMLCGKLFQKFMALFLSAVFEPVSIWLFRMRFLTNS